MSIIGNAIMPGGGGGSGNAAVSLVGPKNSTVSWTGTDNGSASFGDATNIGVTLTKGLYIFSGVFNSVTVFTRTVTVDQDMTVNLFPDGMVYWFGLGSETLVKTANGSKTESTNSIEIADSTRSHAGVRTTNTYTITGKRLKAWAVNAGGIPVTDSANGHVQIRLWTSDSASPWTANVSTDHATFVNAANTLQEIYTAPTQTGDYAFGIHFTNATQGVTGTINVYALWLE